jgi:ribonuclease Z
MHRLAAFALAAVFISLSTPAALPQSDFRVTLLGTGVPVPAPDRFGPSTLIEVGGQQLLFDAGRAPQSDSINWASRWDRSALYF